MQEIKRDVPDMTRPSAAPQMRLEVGFDARPHLYPGEVTGVRHGYVVDVQILHDIRFPFILSDGADADAVGPNAF